MSAINIRAGGGGIITPEQIRDALLSMPDNERRFVITNPEPGEHPIAKIALDIDTDEQVVTTP